MSNTIFKQMIDQEAQDVYGAVAHKEMEQLSSLWLNIVREAAKQDPQLASKQLNISKEFAEAIAEANYSDMLLLISNGMLAFQFAGSEKAAISILKGSTDEGNSSKNVLGLLGSRLANQNKRG